ncbi:Bax inhibitor-1/YccA family protein [Fructobacillus sp. M1-13]|uniref:Bax inhibitor-1/YccA family protein n=1 Tax=Fructobacillus papyriferae TaxID=2713171 RepID=A0ABS5QNJ0_9LACO|nr:Bax inhibitor-1/YccA family protein [Fructobacillus papyriferae]MBS9334586.1 Bax inhibitor-1/YccA family protein [Fructobacillus papyriferae]MCD2158575.1 Bax inhibitor-1/YccA family protein [Fructobacillus papyriferae]
MNNFDFNSRRDVTGADTGMKLFFQKVYGYMAVALAVTAISGYIVQNFFLPQVLSLFTGSFVGTIIVFGIEIALVVMIRNASFQNNPSKAFGLLMTFAVAQGLMLGILLAYYTGASVLAAFVSTAALFAGMAAYGLFTKKSLAGMGSILFGLLIGLLVAIVINIFMASSAFQLLISMASVVIFALYTAYDNNMLRQAYVQLSSQGADEGHLTGMAIVGALMLYLDFINIFYSLLQLFGDSRD